MTGRAVLALALLLGGCSDDEASRSLVIDEKRGTYRGVGIGSSEREVRAALGEPEDDEGFFPAGKTALEVGGPRGMKVPEGAGYRELHYDDSVFALVQGEVFAFMVAVEGATTRAGVAIGDPLERARRRYRIRSCHTGIAGVSPSGPLEYPICRARIRPLRFVSFSRDPIASITIYDRSPVGTPN